MPPLHLREALEEGIPQVFGTNPTIRLPRKEYYFRCAFLRVFCHIHDLPNSVWRPLDRATDDEIDAHLRAQFTDYEEKLRATVAEMHTRL